MRHLLDLSVDLSLVVGFLWPALWYAYGTPFFPTATVCALLLFWSIRSFGALVQQKAREQEERKHE